MKKLFFAMLLLTSCSLFAADLIYTVKVTFSGIPADGDKVIVNGNERIFKNTVATPSTQIQIGVSAGATANNYMTHLGNFPYSSISQDQDSTVITLVGELNVVITASKTGSWGSVAVTPNSVVGSNLILPLTTLGYLPARTNAANYLVTGIRDYATTVFPVTTPALGSFVNTTASQTVSGMKTFTGGAILTNAASRIYGGELTNVWARGLSINPYEGIFFSGIDGFTVAPDSYGRPSIFFGNTIGDTNAEVTAVANYTVDDPTIVTGLTGDGRYGRKTGANTWAANNTFRAITTITNLQGVATNFTFGATNGWVTNLAVFGAFGVTNTAPKLTLNDIDAADDIKVFTLTANGGVFALNAVSDNGLTINPILRSTSAVSSPPYLVEFPNGLTKAAKLQSDAELFVLGKAGFAGVVGIGDTNITVPTSLTKGLVLANGAAAAADPSNGGAVWSVAGELFYRSSASNEGAGQNDRVHNRGAEVVGSGGNYTLTDAYARVDFGGQDPEIALPTAGTYLILATVSVIEGAAEANDSMACKLYDSTNAADLPNTVVTIDYLPVSMTGQLVIQSVYTVASGATVQLYGINNTSARGSIKSTETKLAYVRLF